MNSTVTESPILRISEVIQSTNKTFTIGMGLLLFYYFGRCDAMKKIHHHYFLYAGNILQRIPENL